jgi:creatinine amidohydrolase
MRLGDATSPDVDPTGLLLVVPLGSCEQHGPHLPLDTDTRIAATVAQLWAASRDDVALAPAVAYGASGEHAGFSGTLSIGQAALEHVLVELVRSADAWRGVVLVNGHGGNAEPVRRAVATLTAERRRALAWWPQVDGGDLHAGATETSLLLALAPELVRLDRAEPGDERDLDELMPALRVGGVRAVSANGVLGDPRGATAAAGMQLLADLAASLAQAVERWLDAAPSP